VNQKNKKLLIEGATKILPLFFRKLADQVQSAVPSKAEEFRLFAAEFSDSPFALKLLSKALGVAGQMMDGADGAGHEKWQHFKALGKWPSAAYEAYWFANDVLRKLEDSFVRDTDDEIVTQFLSSQRRLANAAH
jgi:hypothetical protein